MGRIGDKPFSTVDHVVIPHSFNAGLDIGGIGRRHIGFCHRKRRSDFTLQQWTQPLLVLCRCCEHVQQFHVAGVGCIAVEHFRCPGHTAHDLGKRCVFQVAKTSSGFFLPEAR